MGDEEIHPITLVREDGKFFGRYLEEILLAEGFPYIESVETKELHQINPGSHPLTILARAELSSEDARHALSLAERGSTLIVIRPNAGMKELLGLKTEGEISEGYIWWEGARALQIHGTADLYAEDDRLRPLAFLRKQRDGQNIGLGIFTTRKGAGTIMVVAFNLPESIVLTRQGNPDWRNSKGDEWLGGVRPGDMFYRLSGEKWIDTRNTDIPQADLLQRCFVDQMLSLCGLPLPRIWYFPNMQKVSFTAVADSDMADPQQVRIETDIVRSHGGVYSLYLIDKTLDLMEKEYVDDLLSDGNEVALHPDYNRVGDTLRPDRDGLRALYEEMFGRLETKFGIRPISMRHHSVVWCDWIEVPRIEEEFGVTLDNCYGYPCWFGQKDYGGSDIGYLTGSGQPQRFCDLDGNLINVFQLDQNLEDEILLPKKGLGLDGETVAKRLGEFIDRSQKGLYAHVVACFHPIRVATNQEGRKALEGVLLFCQRNGIPMRTLRDIAEFAETRRTVEISNFRRGPRVFSFVVVGSRDVAQRGVTMLVPAARDGRIEVDGKRVDWPIETIGQHEYFASILEDRSLQIRVAQKSLGRSCSC